MYVQPRKNNVFFKSVINIRTKKSEILRSPIFAFYRGFSAFHVLSPFENPTPKTQNTVKCLNDFSKFCGHKINTHRELLLLEFFAYV